MSGPKCETCQFWLNHSGSDWSADDIGFGKCTAVRERWKVQDNASDGMRRSWDRDGTDADEDAWSKARREALRAARAYVQDGSEYYAELVTGPDFGCVLHSPTQDQTKP